MQPPRILACSVLSIVSAVVVLVHCVPCDDDDANFVSVVERVS
jgi:hypothetical protein